MEFPHYCTKQSKTRLHLQQNEKPVAQTDAMQPRPMTKWTFTICRLWTGTELSTRCGHAMKWWRMFQAEVGSTSTVGKLLLIFLESRFRPGPAGAPCTGPLTHKVMVKTARGGGCASGISSWAFWTWNDVLDTCELPDSSSHNSKR